jgi:hypothetical protein
LNPFTLIAGKVSAPSVLFCQAVSAVSEDTFVLAAALANVVEVVPKAVALAATEVALAAAAATCASSVAFLMLIAFVK